MNKISFLNPQGNWDNTATYAAALITGSAAIGLTFVSMPTVVDKGSSWFANGSQTPVVGTHPSDSDAWTLLQAGSWTTSADPTVNNDISEGYAIGTLWVNTSSGNAFICTDNTNGAAVWEAFAGNA